MQQQQKPEPQRGTRLPADWDPSPADVAYAAERGIAGSRLDRVVDDFRDYWVAKPGQAAVKLDWPATWRTWIRRETDRTTGQTQRARAVTDEEARWRDEQDRMALRGKYKPWKPPRDAYWSDEHQRWCTADGTPIYAEGEKR